MGRDFLPGIFPHLGGVTLKEIITVDGPSASGKSSVGRELARALGIPFVSSGILYRGIGYLAQGAGIDLQDSSALGAWLANDPLELRLNSDSHIWHQGQDVTALLHTHEVDTASSRVARHPEVRGYVDGKLRSLPPPFVVEGRDMGREVFPDAEFKFYLTAPVAIRAGRRVGERELSQEEIEAALTARDQNDRNQSLPAPDARIVDTAELSLAQVVETLLEQIRSRP